MRESVASVIWSYHNELLRGTPDQVRAAMNLLGAKGWECITIVGSMAYFKRGRVADTMDDIQQSEIAAPRHNRQPRLRANA